MQFVKSLTLKILDKRIKKAVYDQGFLCLLIL